MLKRRLIILTAVALEAQAVAAVWKLPAPKAGKPVRDDKRAPAVEIHLVGIGTVRMPADLRDPPVCGIIMAGLAGALDPTLRIGDIVIDDCPAGWLPAIPYRRGRIVVSPTLVSTPAEKAKLFQETGALAVDMESAAARAVAAELGVPYISVRAISDAADELLDPAVLKMVNAFGHPRPLAIAAALIRRPSLIPRLRRLAETSKRAAANLAAAVAAIVQHGREVELGHEGGDGI